MSVAEGWTRPWLTGFVAPRGFPEVQSNTSVCSSHQIFWITIPLPAGNLGYCLTTAQKLRNTYPLHHFRLRCPPYRCARRRLPKKTPQTAGTPRQKTQHGACHPVTWNMDKYQDRKRWPSTVSKICPLFKGEAHLRHACWLLATHVVPENSKATLWERQAGRVLNMGQCNQNASKTRVRDLLAMRACWLNPLLNPYPSTRAVRAAPTRESAGLLCSLLPLLRYRHT